MVSICACERLRSLRIFSEWAGSAPHGGISRVRTFSRITFAHGRTSSYDVKVIGATSPCRWQLAQLLNTIGATSLAKVGTLPAGAAAGPEAWTVARTARVPSTIGITRFMDASGK